MNNFLFKDYAKVVEQLFAPPQRIGSRISVFPGDRPSAAQENPPLPVAHIAELIDPHGVTVIQQLVDHLRRAWLPSADTPRPREEMTRRRADESTASQPPAGTPLPGKESEQIQARFAAFRAAIASGDEQGMAGNPFYELTQLLYHHNLNGAKKLFGTLQEPLMSSPPEPVPLLRSFREIWLTRQASTAIQLSHGRMGRSLGLFRKLSDQVDAWMGMGKVAVAILLFFGSTFTTAQGINDLLQSQELSALFGGLFDGREAEVMRYGMAVLVGLLLSSAILDYKERLFSAIVEQGGVLRGIRTALLRHPRWMILATFLTAFSVKTNYDGIVSLISKKADLAKQSEQIRSRVKRALGSPFFVNVVEPDDLHDVQGLLQNAASDSISKFSRVPDDEVSGVASSGDPRMGPRYWGKYFIVNGGYVPGVQDVAHSTQSLTAGFSARIDEMLRDSGLDLRSSAADKISALRTRYDDHLRRTEAVVEARLDKLRGLMEMRGYSLEEIKRVFALEHYQINEIVLSMADALEENKKEYERVAAELNRLTDAYVAVLQQVDKSGAASRREYHIEGKLAIPDLDAIRELKNTHIPKAQHKSFAELKEFLAGEYGIALANSMLLAILFVSFCMDLLDPLIYSRWTAIIGRQDRAMYPDLLGYLREWENDFIVVCHQFFYRRDVQQVFSGLALPNRTGIRNAFYLLLEELDPLLKDPRDQSFMQHRGEWFRGLFLLTRTQDMRCYNRRAKGIGRLVAHKERYFQQLLEYLLPGVRFAQGTGRDSFMLVQRKTELGQEQQRALFAWELLAVSGRLTQESPVLGNLPHGPAADLDALVELEQKRKSISRLRDGKREVSTPAAETGQSGAETPSIQELPAGLLKRRVRPDGALNPLLQLLFAPGSPSHRAWQRFWETAFLPPWPPFAHTRRRWLQEVARQDGYPMEEMDGLYDFMPDLKEVLLVTIPRIRHEVLGSLAEIRRRFPQRCQQEGIAAEADLEERITDLEKESLQVLGLSPSMGDQTRLYAPASGVALELEGVSRAVLDHVGGDPTGFHEKVAALMTDTARQLAQAQTIEQAVSQEMIQILKEVKRSHESIKQILLKINMSSTTSRKSSLPLRDMLRLLRQNKDVLEQTPRQSETILKTVEQLFHDRGTDGGAQTYSEASLELLYKLQGEERHLLDGLIQILVQVQGAEESADMEIDLLRLHGGQERDGHDETEETSLPDAPPLGLVGESSAPVDLRMLPTLSELAIRGEGDAPDGEGWPEEALLQAPALRELPEEEPDSQQESPREAEPERYAEELEGSTLVVHEATETREAQRVGLEQEAVATGKQTETALFRASLGEEESPLIVVAEFRHRQPGELPIGESGAGAVGGERAARPSRRPPMRWDLEQSRMTQEDDFFAGGVVPALPTVVAGRPGQTMPGQAEPPLATTRRPSALPVRQPLPTPPVPSKPRQMPPVEQAVAGGMPLLLPPASLEFKSKSGVNFRGVARDVSLNGCYAENVDLARVQAMDTGRLRLVSDVGVHQFPCEVVEVSASDITLRLFANGHQFESVTKEKIFKEVWRDHQAVQQEQTVDAEQPPTRWRH
ncbi:MAG: hypothetical protein H7837_08965 [Magnetococcus sp. MYC-9]